MTYVFKPKVSPALIKKLKQHSIVQMTLEKIGLPLKTILQEYSMIVPSKFEYGVGWVVIGPRHGLDGDLIEKTLKLAWSFTTNDYKSDLYLAVCYQLSGYESGMELLNRRSQCRKISKLLRPRIPAAGQFIEEFLKHNSLATKELIWAALPESDECQDLYRDGNFLYCGSLPNKQLSYRAFGIRVEKLRKKTYT